MLWESASWDVNALICSRGRATLATLTSTDNTDRYVGGTPTRHKCQTTFGFYAHWPWGWTFVCVLDVHESVHLDTTMKVTNKMQLYRLIYYSQSALHVSGDVFAHHQEHLTVFTVSGSVHPRCRRLVSWMSRNWTAVWTHPRHQPAAYLLTPWSRVLLEKLTSKLCS